MEKNEKKKFGLLIFPNIITEQWGSYKIQIMASGPELANHSYLGVALQAVGATSTFKRITYFSH